MSPEQIARILHEVRDKYARFGRGDADIFRALENRLIPLTPGEAVQFQELGQRRWLNGTYDGPVENPDDPQRSGDAYVLTKSGKRVAVFLSSVQRRPAQGTPHTPLPEDRWFIVVLRELDGTLNAVSRRTPGLDGHPFSGPWGLLTQDEADRLVDLYNADDRDASTAEAVEVYRYDLDPEWPEELS